MTKENADALKVLTNTINRLADEAVDQADYDRTRNARITKVYNDEYDAFYIVGYDYEVDGKSYHIKKQRGKGINAKENDIVKLHIPCNNMGGAYLSYPHDPEDFIKYFVSSEGDSYGIYWNSGRYESVITYVAQNITFPATTKQFSSATISMDFLNLPQAYRWDFIVTADNGVTGVVVNYNVTEINPSIPLIIKFYNENPTTTSPVTKSFNYYIKAMAIIPNL